MARLLEGLHLTRRHWSLLGLSALLVAVLMSGTPFLAALPIFLLYGVVVYIWLVRRRRRFARERSDDAT